MAKVVDAATAILRRTKVKSAKEILLSKVTIVDAEEIGAGPKGEQGEKGRQGLQGLSGLDGRDGRDGKDGSSFRWLGDFKKGNTYQVNDVVYFQGSSYIATKTTSDTPTYADSGWDKMSASGAPGARGAPGVSATVEKSPSFSYTDSLLTRVDYESGAYKEFVYTDAGLLQTLTYTTSSTTITKTFYWNEDGTLDRIEEA